MNIFTNTLRALFSVLLIALVFCGYGLLSPQELAQGFENGQKQMFLVSAYYSPLPGQSRYLRGNYEAEIRLNGRGTNAADGTPVYPGMLAAPKSYAFGTKIEIPGLGVGVVHDRGGAIREKDGYHRIDVWMGRGEEGLDRALQWGMRMVEGTIYTDTNIVGTDLRFDHIPATPSSLATHSASSLFAQNLEKGDRGSAVSKLQQHLEHLGFFTEEPTGYYGSVTEQAVFAFQEQFQIVSHASAQGAGVFGPQTRSKLEEVLSENSEKIAVSVPMEVLHASAPEDSALKARAIPYLHDNLKPNMEGRQVRRLQALLASFGFFSGEISGVYDGATKDGVIMFQKEAGILQSAHDYGAGYYGPKTHAAFLSVLAERRQKREALEENMSVVVAVEPM